MSKQIQLPSGGVVTLRDGASVKHKDRKALVLSMDSDQEASDMVKGLAAQDRLIAMAVEHWEGVNDPETGQPLTNPRHDASSLDELSIADIDALTEAIDDFRKALFPNMEPSPDPQSPTEPSNG